MKAMYELKVISHFSAAHQLRDYEGACERLHGHNWKVEIFVTGRVLGDDGLLLDFKEIKRATQKVLERFDHQLLNEVEPFGSVNPSSENIARHIFDALSSQLNRGEVKVSRVTAWESETACATYRAT
jgi:6-pyruvoyltetrahydropterin/6-carboxytetrahydropterin synthase